MASLSCYSASSSTSSIPPSTETCTMPPLAGRIPVPASLRTLACLNLPMVGTTPLPSQMRRVATHSSSSSTSKLAKDSLSATVSSSSSSSLPALDFKEGKSEAVSTSLPTNRNASTFTKNPLTSFPRIEIKVKGNDCRSNLQKRKILEQQARDFECAGDFQSALTCIEEIVKIANILEVSCISIDRWEIELRIKQFKHDMDLSHVPIIKMRIQNFLQKYPVEKYPNEREFVINLLKVRIEINYHDYNEARQSSFCLQIKEDLYKIIKLFKELNVSVAKDPFVLTYQGFLYLSQLEIKPAYETFKKALKLAPNNPFILNQLGIACIYSANQISDSVDDLLLRYQLKVNKRKKYKEAIEYFKQALAMDEKDLFALRGCDLAYYELEEMESAQQYASLAMGCDHSLETE